jgi:hypothetical protein
LSVLQLGQRIASDTTAAFRDEQRRQGQAAGQTTVALDSACAMSYVPRTVFDNDEYRSRATTLAETADSARGLLASGPEGDH